jgi:hypothetical protein
VTKNTRICEYLSTSVSFGQHNHTAASLLEFWIPEPGTTISGFVDNKKIFNPDRPTLDFFDM